MAQTVIINGVSYQDVKEIKIPLASNPNTLMIFPDTTDGTAAAGDIKAGKTGYVDGVKVTGSMPVNGAVDKTLDINTPSVTIPAGYTEGGTVDIVAETKTITPTKSAQNVTPTSGKVLSKVTVNAIPAQYITTTDGTAAADDIKKGKTAYVNGAKVTGTHTDPQITLANGVLSIV